MLKNHTTLRLGAAADFFIEPADRIELRRLLVCLKSNGLPVRVIGAGSNIVVGDMPLRLAVIKLSAQEFKRVRFAGSRMIAGAGCPLTVLMKLAQKNGFSGLEFLSGIPGTLGGALAMNAGAWGKNIGDLVAKVRVMDYNGSVKTFGRKKIRFSYRESSLSRYIILEAELKLCPDMPGRICERAGIYLKRRRESQDVRAFSAGCVFKNPSGHSAGELIDACGLKGKKIGRAAISLKHANFILNTGMARSADFLKLISLAQEKVKAKFGIDLEPEVKIWQ